MTAKDLKNHEPDMTGTSLGFMWEWEGAGPDGMQPKAQAVLRRDVLTMILPQAACCLSSEEFGADYTRGVLEHHADDVNLYRIVCGDAVVHRTSDEAEAEIRLEFARQMSGDAEGWWICEPGEAFRFDEKDIDVPEQPEAPKPELSQWETELLSFDTPGSNFNLLHFWAKAARVKAPGLEFQAEVSCGDRYGGLSKACPIKESFDRALLRLDCLRVILPGAPGRISCCTCSSYRGFSIPEEAAAEPGEFQLFYSEVMVYEENSLAWLKIRLKLCRELWPAPEAWQIRYKGEALGF